MPVPMYYLHIFDYNDTHVGDIGFYLFFNDNKMDEQFISNFRNNIIESCND